MKLSYVFSLTYPKEERKLCSQGRSRRRACFLTSVACCTLSNRLGQNGKTHFTTSSSLHFENLHFCLSEVIPSKNFKNYLLCILFSYAASLPSTPLCPPSPFSSRSTPQPASSQKRPGLPGTPTKHKYCKYYTTTRHKLAQHYTKTRHKPFYKGWARESSRRKRFPIAEKTSQRHSLSHCQKLPQNT